MRVEDNNKTPVSGQKQEEQRHQNNQGRQSQGHQGGQNGQQFDPNYNPFASLGITTATTGLDTEAFNQFQEDLVKLTNDPEIKQQLSIEIVPITSQELKLPALVMCAVGKDKTVATYTLLIESMLQGKIEPVIEPVRDNQNTSREIIIDRPTSIAFSERMRSHVTKAAAMRYKVSEDQVVNIGKCVVPEEADLSNPASVRTMFNGGLTALVDYLGGNLIGRITPAILKNPVVAMTQTTTVTPGATHLNKLNVPVAADFTAHVKLVNTNQNQNKSIHEVHDTLNEVQVAEVRSYVDFTPFAMQGQPQPAYPGAPAPITPGFIPTLVCTEIAGLTNQGRSIEDLRTQLLGLVSTAALTSNHGWVRAFEKLPNQKSSKPDIGLLGIEHDPYGRGVEGRGKVKVESASFNNKPKEGVETPLGVATKWCTKGVALAIDVEQGGRLEWVQSVFVAAANNIKGANQSIIEECDALTDGIFSSIWAEVNKGNASASVVRNETVVVHTGTYTDSEGKKAELRTLGHLSMLESSPKDLQFVETATAAMIPGMCNNITLSDRRRAITTAANANITGLATRVFLAPMFVQCLISALAQAKVSIKSDDALGYMINQGRVGMGSDYMGEYHTGDFYKQSHVGVEPGSVYNGTYYNQAYMY